MSAASDDMLRHAIQGMAEFAVVAEAAYDACDNETFIHALHTAQEYATIAEIDFLTQFEADHPSLGKIIYLADEMLGTYDGTLSKPMPLDPDD